MKVLAINASPHGENGFTDRILQPLLVGMRQAGAETEIIYLATKKIHHCIGCFSCWLKTPGKCMFNDDMDLLLKKMIDSDLIIYGTPLYFFTMTGLLKDFFDRTLPLALPFMEKTQSGITTHPCRYPGKQKKYLLVSTCGFPEITHFDALIATMKKITAAGENEYLGEILRPSAGIMNTAAVQPIIKEYFALLKEAGKQLIEKNKIDPDTHKKLQQSWISVDDFVTNSNKYFQSVMSSLAR
jgi:multimeric flavodoxin WrbA